NRRLAALHSGPGVRRMRQWQPFRRALGHGADSASRLRRGRSLVRRQTHPEERQIPPEDAAGLESGKAEVTSENKGAGPVGPALFLNYPIDRTDQSPFTNFSRRSRPFSMFAMLVA